MDGLISSPNLEEITIYYVLFQGNNKKKEDQLSMFHESSIDYPDQSRYVQEKRRLREESRWRRNRTGRSLSLLQIH